MTADESLGISTSDSRAPGRSGGPPRAVRSGFAETTSHAEGGVGPQESFGRIPPEPTEHGNGVSRLDSGYRVDPWPTLLALGLSLAGFLVVAAQLYVLRYEGTGPDVWGLPSRAVFVFGLALSTSPLVLAIFRRPPVLFVLPGIALVFLLYPLFTPYGVPSGQDAIYNFQFAFSLLSSGHWTPGAGVSMQAVAYSYYPASGVFNAELSAFTGVPLYQTFLWGEPLLRLLLLPLTIYALGKRYFGLRVGLVSVLVLLATPSILFNYPVESEFAIPFFALALTMIGYLLIDGPDRPNRLVVVAALFAGFVVISHQLSAYVLAIWLAILLELWAVVRSYSDPHLGRVAVIVAAYLVFFGAFTLGVSRPNFLQNYQAFSVVVNQLVNPSSLSVSTATSIGGSFPEYMLIWSYLAYAALLLVALLALRRWLRTQRRRFMTPNLAVAIFLVVITLPLLVTSFGFLPQRVMEYGALFMAPAVAWWVTARLVPGAAVPTARFDRRSLAPSRHLRISPSWRRAATTAGVLGLVMLIFTGASLVPFSTRDQFAPASSLTTESPLYIDQSTYALGIWAHTHLTSSTAVWGDTLTLCVFGGFGRFEMAYDQYLLFNGTTIPLSVWSLVSVGSYVVVDKYMTTSTPQFPGPSNLQPTEPLTPGQLAKFNEPAFFDLVFQDSTFTIYEVTAVP